MECTLFTGILVRLPSKYLRGNFPGIAGEEKCYVSEDKIVVLVDRGLPDEDFSYYVTCTNDEAPWWLKKELTDYATIDYFGITDNLIDMAQLINQNSLPFLDMVNRSLQVWVEVRRDFTYPYSERTWHVRVSITRQRLTDGQRQFMTIADFLTIAQRVRDDLPRQSASG
jgi:hypothetical protein